LVRYILPPAAQAAVQKKGWHFQFAFGSLRPWLGYTGAIWAIAHRLARVRWKILLAGAHDLEYGTETRRKPTNGALRD
jgi:hypothetical protein